MTGRIAVARQQGNSELGRQAEKKKKAAAGPVFLGGYEKE